jgi:large conductance mechanosensitive channel
VTLNFGVFLNTIISFLVVAFAVFMLVRAVNRLRKQQAAAPAAPTEEVILLREIRDSLRHDRKS